MYAMMVRPRHHLLGLIRIRMLKMQFLPTASRVAMPDTLWRNVSHEDACEEWI